MDDFMEKIEAALKEEEMAKNAEASALKELRETQAVDADAASAFQNALDSDKERLCKEWARTTKRLKGAQNAYNDAYKARLNAVKKREELVAACD